MRYMVSRQVQNESVGSVWRSARPAIARWNACECRLAMPGSRQPAGVRWIRDWAGMGIVGRRREWVRLPCRGVPFIGWRPCSKVSRSCYWRCWRWSWWWRSPAIACAAPARAGAGASTTARRDRMTVATEAAVTDAWDGVLVGASLATLEGDAGWGAIDDGALGWRDGRIVFAGPRDALPDAPGRLADSVVEADGGWVTPGLVDCHTHLVFGGDRAAEFEQRLQGASYEQIARSGGGIVSTVRATRAADEEALLAQSLPRARALLADGVTTLEIKSGYGLDLDGERRMLRVARRIGQSLGVDVRSTFLGAHALPPEYAGRAEAYIDAVCEWLPLLHGEGLVDAVDAFAERIGFSIAQTRRVFEVARALGLPVKL